MQSLKYPVNDDLHLSDVIIPYDPAIITPAIAHAINCGYFEAEEAAQLPHIVKPDDIVLDIGAGIGYISTIIARLARRVISVEANPDLMPYMAALHTRNAIDNITRLNVVLGAKSEGTATFYQRADFWMGSLAATPNPYKSKVEVPLHGLSALLEQQAVTLIVCDIEGAESWLFKDVDLNKVDRVYLELHDHITGLKGIAAVFDTMALHGFAYDPRASSGAIVLFRRLEENESLRPYARIHAS